MARTLNKRQATEGGSKRAASPIYLDQMELFDNVVVLERPSRRHRIVFGWYGGKFNHLEWLLPLLPKAHHYCEPFSGSAAVLLNREPSPVETYNDIDGDVVNFFRVLRDRHEELIRAIALTPFAREEFHQAINGSQSSSDLERARHFYIRARQARTGLSPNRHTGPLGQLQEYQSRRYVRRCFALAWRRRSLGRDCSSPASCLDRKSACC